MQMKRCVLAWCGGVWMVAALTAAAAHAQAPAPAGDGKPDALEHARKHLKPGGALTDGSKPRTPQQVIASFKTGPGLVVQTALAEPAVRQPLFVNFDHRGRMWVVQYIQYPFPAGLTMVKYDRYLRAVYDRVPAPPGRKGFVPGADKITVHEDADGDGVYESHKDVLTGLNIATAVTLGRGGIWVLNPPYLLFYPDRDGDDKPDTQTPQVHLEGFGLEDTHAVANSLRWGPDGWLYGAQGSTCTATVSSAVTKNVHFKGQAIWRYHPTTKVFEVFAEGGGNTFAVEFDDKGRLYSGTNWGSYRGVHYVQGGRYVKNWGKHGPLMNPHSYGFFHHMPHEGFQPRFSHSFIIYQGGGMPSYQGQMISIIPLRNRVQASELKRRGSTFATHDTHTLLETDDRWFRPVDIKAGPDGAVYIADWYDSRLSHLNPHDTWDRDHGRVYRVSAKGATGGEAGAAGLPRPFDLTRMSGSQLVDLLSHDNKWVRQQALRVLGDRRDVSLTPRLRRMVREHSGQLALEALWALNLSGGLDDQAAMAALAHADPFVRQWAVRLLGDAHPAGDAATADRTQPLAPAIADRLIAMTHDEPHAQVRSQLASTANRLPGDAALPMLRGLIGRSDDVDDPHLPLLIWWALEAKAIDHRDEVMAMFEDSSFWRQPMVDRWLIERIGRRYVAAGEPADLAAVARLISLAPDQAKLGKLARGMAQALQGGALAAPPANLKQAVAKLWTLPGADRDTDLVQLAMRLGSDRGHAAALTLMQDARVKTAQRIALIQAAGQLARPAAAPALLDMLRNEKAADLRRAALSALTHFDAPAIAGQVLAVYGDLPADLQTAARGLLASRASWARRLLAAVDQGAVARQDVSLDQVRQMRLLESRPVDELIAKLWGKVRPATTQQKRDAMQRIARVLQDDGPKPDLAAGKKLFTQLCAQCHKLHGQGGQTGPELTGYERDNLDFMLLAIVDPSAAIREEYTAFELQTADGLHLVGYLVNETPKTVTFDPGAGQPQLTIPRKDITKLQASPMSRMPEGLIDALPDAMLRNLFSYLTSREMTNSQ